MSEEEMVGMYGQPSDVAALRARKQGPSDPLPALAKESPKDASKETKDPKGSKSFFPGFPSEPGKDSKTPAQVGHKPPFPPFDDDDEPGQGPGGGHHPGRPHDGDNGHGDGHGNGHGDDDGHGNGHGHADEGEGSHGGGDDSDAREEMLAGTVGETCSVPGSSAGASGSRGGGTLCLGLKYVVYQDAQGRPVQSDREAANTLREVNELWRACGVQFQIDRFIPVAPERYRLRFRTANHQELNEIRRRFMDDQSLLIVTTGAWNRAGTLGNSWANAWTNLPGEGVYGSVLEQSVGQNANVIAHELGHYLSLDHAEHARDLMHPVIYRNSSDLSPAQCASARWAARKFWSRMIR